MDRPRSRFLSRWSLPAASGIFLSLLTGSGTALAQTNLVQDPYFNQTSSGGTITASEQFGTFQASGCTTGTSCYSPGQTLANWSSPGGYTFVFMAPLTTAANDSYGASNATLDSAVTLYSVTNSNIIGGDGNTGVAPILQTINGLTPGKEAAVSFAWAGAQQQGYVCPTGGCTSDWVVDLGSSPTQTTAVASYPTQGFTGWFTTTMYFLPTSTSEVLSFLAAGTPTSGAPPFVLLTNVSVKTVPEPASVMIVASGILGLAAFKRSRRGRDRARAIG